MSASEDVGTVLLKKAVKSVISANPEAKKCMKRRSVDPFDYTDFISSTLKFVAKHTMKKFVEVDRLYLRFKSDAESRKLREHGNQVFRSNQDLRSLETALDLYTRSIIYAVPNGKDMAMGYANRSAVLLKLDRPRESLEDIGRAIDSNYPEELMPKLLFRKAESLSTLAKHNYIQAKFWFKQLPANDHNWLKLKKALKGYSASGYESVVDSDPPLPQIKSPHPEFPFASDAVEVEYSGVGGKKIVATRDIGVAEVLVVEKPYMANFIAEIVYFHCSRCLRPFFACLPCETCINVVYCSEKCKAAAWKEYHSLECSILNLLVQHEAVPTGSLKLLFMIYQEAGGMEQLKERIRNFYKRNDPKLQGEWYLNSTLECILSMKSKIKRISNDYFQEMVAVAIRSLYYLAESTNFFGGCYSRKCFTAEELENILLKMSREPNILFIGGLLLQLQVIIRYENIAAKERIRKLTNHHNRGIFLMPFLKQINSNCNGNVWYQFIGTHVVLHTTIPIKKGEEIVTSGNSWMVTSKANRKDDMEEPLVNCPCRACKENWPTFHDLKNWDTRVKSPEMKLKMEKILQPLPSLLTDFYKGLEEKIKNKEKTLSDLKAMVEAIYEGVNLPCLEQSLLHKALSNFYSHTGMTAKMRCQIVPIPRIAHAGFISIDKNDGRVSYI